MSSDRERREMLDRAERRMERAAGWTNQPRSVVTCQVAEVLRTIGWSSPNDAQWAHLEMALPLLRRALTPDQPAGDTATLGVNDGYAPAGEPRTVGPRRFAGDPLATADAPLSPEQESREPRCERCGKPADRWPFCQQPGCPAVPAPQESEREWCKACGGAGGFPDGAYFEMCVACDGRGWRAAPVSPPVERGEENAKMLRGRLDDEMARWRREGPFAAHPGTLALIAEAALIALEAQAAEVERLRIERDRLLMIVGKERDLDNDPRFTYAQTGRIHRAAILCRNEEIDTLTAQVKRLREALQRVIQAYETEGQHRLDGAIVDARALSTEQGKDGTA